MKFSQKSCFIQCGEDFTAILTRDGGVFTFGAGMYGQLGHNSAEAEFYPRKVFDLMGSEVTQIACGRCHTMAYIAASNKLYVFGLGANGQLGVGTATNYMSPTPITSLKFNKLSEPPLYTNFYLHSIYCGGDQSFIAYTNVSKVELIEFRLFYLIMSAFRKPSNLTIKTFWPIGKY